MPIPQFDPTTGNLPPGVHLGSWDEINSRFGGTPDRLRLLDGWLRILEELRSAGCERAYIDVSFVTAKDVPGDFDGCWDPQDVDASRLDPVLLDFTNGRAAQKAKYGGEMFVTSFSAGAAGPRFLEFFQQDKATGNPKGIVAIDLGGLP
jgi:hypothetical protein